MRSRVGWLLMGLPTGIRRPWPLMLRWGPYRLGALLVNPQSTEGDGTSPGEETEA